MDGPVIGVVGGSGGVGASSFAAVLAGVAGGVLVDLDPIAGGIDVLLGAEETSGPRWSELRLGGGHLDPGLLAEALPRWGAVRFLSADVAPDAAAVRQIVEVARQVAPVVVDLPRWPGPARGVAVESCSLVVLVSGAQVRGVTAARAVRAGLGGTRVGLVVRPGRTGAPPARVAELVEAPLLGVLPDWRIRADEPLHVGQLPRAAARLARGVVEGAYG